jgi:hypothetical protein
MPTLMVAEAEVLLCSTLRVIFLELTFIVNGAAWEQQAVRAFVPVFASPSYVQCTYAQQRSTFPRCLYPTQRDLKAAP